jgi:molybdate/tungstate transport system permease protein
MTGRGQAPSAFALLGAILVLFLVLPLLYFLAALGRAQLQSVLGDAVTLQALVVSLVTATITTTILTVLGVPLGYLLARHDFAGKPVLNVLVLLPLILPPAASGIILLLFFGPNQGLGALLDAGGIQIVDNPAGIIVAQMFVSAPFVIVTARSAFEGVPVVHERISRTLGEGPFMTFWRVALPLARDGIAAGVIFAWMRSMGEFGATLVLAYHPYTLPVLMWVQLSGSGLAYALPVVLLALIVTVLLLGLMHRRRPDPARPWPLAW